MFDCIKSSLLPTELALKLKTITPDELHLFEKKDRIEDLGNIKQKLKPSDINNISFIM